MWIGLSLIVLSPFLFWLVWELALVGPREAWLSLTAGSAWSYAHNGLLHAALLAALLLASTIIFRMARHMIGKPRNER